MTFNCLRGTAATLFVSLFFAVYVALPTNAETVTASLPVGTGVGSGIQIEASK